MKINYITIEREYGSGGSKIARQLAEECGIPCYGREILESISKEQNISVDKLQEFEKNATASLLYSLVLMSQNQPGDLHSNPGRICLDEQVTIQKLAEQGPAIFLGHCASKALEKKEGVLRVFIHADWEEKMKRIDSDYKLVGTDAEHAMKKADKKRANFYTANTTKKWTDIHNYDVVLDSSHFGIDQCVAFLKDLYEKAHE